ncbi:MAG: hypothetical protein JJV98_09645 [Desulfosarcina sp.]|nr:hypothetical protein [Desulfobacterales bacterium]
MKIARFMATGLVWAAVHFLASVLIVPATLKAGAAGSGITGLLTWLTKILYFPVLALALYPRHWFPGYWIYVPIVLNSLLWGLFLAATMRIVLALRRRLRPGTW